MRKAIWVLGLVAAACGGGGNANNDGGPNVNGVDASTFECVNAEDCAGQFEICVANMCLPATCEDNQLTGNESDIDCGGDCVPCTEGQVCIGANDCMTLFCDGSSGSPVCRDCQSTEDCVGAPGSYCSGGLCVATRAQGDNCSTSTECSSGHCVDGVCCDGPCDGACATCSTGTCSLVPAGQPSDGDCPDDGVCGRDGTCDGVGGCRLYPNATACPLSTCDGGQTGTGMCNGAGACVSTGGASCDPYICGGATCRTNCTSDSHCVSGFYCSSNSCVAKKAQGQACTGGGNQCQTGFCVDGFCCNSACGGTCKSCNGSVTASLNGECANVLASAGAQGDCPAAASCPGGSCCGNTGTCNGAGACTKRTGGTVCVAQTCSNGTQSSQRTCNGSGTCTSATTTACAPYQCNGTSCRTSCSSDTHCQSGYYCSGNACVPVKADGASCSADSQCLHGSCGPNVGFSTAKQTCCAQVDFGSGAMACPVENNTVGPGGSGWYCPSAQTGACTFYFDFGGFP